MTIIDMLAITLAFIGLVFMALVTAMNRRMKARRSR